MPFTFRFYVRQCYDLIIALLVRRVESLRRRSIFLGLSLSIEASGDGIDGMVSGAVCHLHFYVYYLCLIFITPRFSDFQCAESSRRED